MAAPETLSPDLAASVRGLRAFVPSRDYEASKRFYRDLGFEVVFEGADVTAMRIGDAAFLLQNFYQPQLAGNFVMELSVRDVAAWWAHIEALDLPAGHGVKPPLAPKVMPWGPTVAFVFDPCGVLWHVSQPKSA